MEKADVVIIGGSAASLLGELRFTADSDAVILLSHRALLTQRPLRVRTGGASAAQGQRHGYRNLAGRFAV